VLMTSSVEVSAGPAAGVIDERRDIGKSSYRRFVGPSLLGSISGHAPERVS